MTILKRLTSFVWLRTRLRNRMGAGFGQAMFCLTATDNSTFLLRMGRFVPIARVSPLFMERFRLQHMYYTVATTKRVLTQRIST